MGSLPIPASMVKNLGIWFDAKLTFDAQTSALAGKRFRLLKMLRKILNFLPLSAQKTVIQTLTVSRLDYCNTL